ncbi:MAG: VanZ family protein [Atopostipes suicloacalis]|nr:VanZ family protein [Atopostipes suicloacalis]MDN6731188.1 VanZ family protein [Atopostipes suicloacalis]
MKDKYRTTRILLMTYLILLIWIILMKTEFSFASIYRMRSLNLIPLEGTAVRNQQLDYQEISLNVLIFVPLGIYLSILKRQWPFWKKLLPIFFLSLLFESLQYIFSIGASDITDLIANTVGGALGMIVYLLLSKVIKDQKRTVHFFNLLALIVTIIFLIFCFYTFHSLY